MELMLRILTKCTGRFGNFLCDLWPFKPQDSLSVEDINFTFRFSEPISASNETNAAKALKSGKSYCLSRFVYLVNYSVKQPSKVVF